MKQFLLFICGFFFLTGCSTDKAGFIDDYYDSVPDDGVSFYSFYRLANATDYPLTVGVCELGTDIEYGTTCQPGYAFVYTFVSSRETPFNRTFAHIALSFLYPQKADITYAYPNFGTRSATPDLCDESQWHIERIDERTVWRTYYVTDADYSVAAAQ